MQSKGSLQVQMSEVKGDQKAKEEKDIEGHVVQILFRRVRHRGAETNKLHGSNGKGKHSRIRI